MRSSNHSPASRVLACLMVLAALSWGCVLAPAPDPVPGLPEFQGFGLVSVPGGVYSVAGRNLMVQRSDVSVDTRILAGTAIGATYNSATASWHWSYQMSFDGETFVDREGAVYDVSSLPDGSAIPGTYWVRVDADTVKTKGGLAFDFDAQGRLDAAYWTSNPYPRYRYVHDPGFVEQRECLTADTPVADCRLVFTVDLGPYGPTRIVDAESLNVGVTREALYGYDAAGHLATARTPFEVDGGLPGTRYEYGSGGLLTAIVSSEGARIEYHWLFGWLVQVTRIGEGNPSQAFTYPQLVDEETKLYSVTCANPRGGRTRYTFTEAGHVTSIERIDSGEVMTIVWNQALNRPSEIIGFDGAVRQFQDFLDDDPTTVIEPSGDVVRLAYEPDGVDFDAPLSRPVASVSDSLGPVATTVYDAAGRPVAITNGAGETTTRDYVGVEVSSSESPWGSTVDFVSFGVHGHWRTANVSWVPETPVQRKFDRVGDLVVPAAGLQEGGVLERAYDASRGLASLEVGATDESGAVTASDFVNVTRRSDGRMLGVTRPYGADRELEYDALGRVSRVRERVDGAWKDTTYEYDAAGDLTAVERPNGMREEFDHDLYGRTLERRILRDGMVEGRALFEWADGHLVRWYDSVRDQWETTLYDAAGRPEAVTWSALGESITYDYDLRSRTTRKTFRFGALSRVIEIEWDLADRRSRVFTRDGNDLEQDLVRLDYQQGRLAAIEYGNGLRRETLFDAVTQRFVGYRTTDLATSAVVEETTFTREAKTEPTRLEVTSRTRTPLATTEEQYWLGLGGNLSSPESKIGARVFRWQAWTWIDGVLQDQDQQVYAWDERSNRVDDSMGDVLSYNAERNRLLGATVHAVSHSYTYDDAGYATSRDGMPITWTAAGRLATLGPGSNPLVQIEWDLAGRPVSISALGASRQLALFGGRVEYDAATGQVGWLHLGRVSLPFVGDARIYRHLDSLGNVSFTTDETGAVTSHRRYHPFGLDRVYGADSFDEGDDHGFVGGVELRHDGVETGLVLLGARVLDSDVGRFLSQDPAFDLVNSYTYARGNPVEWTDTDGRRLVVKPNAATDLGNFAGFLVASGTYATALAGLMLITGDPVAAGVVGGVGAIMAGVGGGLGVLADSIRVIQGAESLEPTSSVPPGSAPDSSPPAQVKRIDLRIEFGGIAIPPAPVPALGVGCAPAPGLAASPRGERQSLLLLVAGMLLSLCVTVRIDRVRKNRAWRERRTVL